jgi:hypothetical protein
MGSDAMASAHKLGRAHGESGGTFLRFGEHEEEEKKRMKVVAAHRGGLEVVLSLASGAYAGVWAPNGNHSLSLIGHHNQLCSDSEQMKPTKPAPSRSCIPNPARFSPNRN